jgi:hypothetical protein
MMRAVVWEKPGKVTVTDVPDPSPGHGVLVIQVDPSLFTGPLLGQPFTLGQFPETLGCVRNGEGIKIQVTPGS